MTRGEQKKGGKTFTIIFEKPNAHFNKGRACLPSALPVVVVAVVVEQALAQQKTEAHAKVIIVTG